MRKQTYFIKFILPNAILTHPSPFGLVWFSKSEACICFDTSCKFIANLYLVDCGPSSKHKSRKAPSQMKERKQRHNAKAQSWTSWTTIVQYVLPIAAVVLSSCTLAHPKWQIGPGDALSWLDARVGKHKKNILHLS